MTVDDLFAVAYVWADSHALELLLASLVVPVVGTLAAWVGKGGKTDADGRFIASVVMLVAMLAFAAEMFGVGFGVLVKDHSVLEANAALVLAPFVCLLLSAFGLRMVFPLSELGPMRVMGNLGLFALVSLGVLWFLSRFRGWGILFLGSFGQLLIFGAVVVVALYYLYRRAFGLTTRRS